MATARKAPAKRAASARNAGARHEEHAAHAGESAREGSEMVQTQADRGEEGSRRRRHAHRARANGSRGSAHARATSPRAQVPASRKRASARQRRNGEADLAGDGASAQALVRDPQHEGEVVRKSRAVTDRGRGARPDRRAQGRDHASRVLGQGVRRSREARPHPQETDSEVRARASDQSRRSVHDARALGRRPADFGACRAEPSGNASSRRARSSRRSSSSSSVTKSCRRADCRSASRNTFSISRSISYRARCTSIPGRRWKTKP